MLVYCMLGTTQTELFAQFVYHLHASPNMNVSDIECIGRKLQAVQIGIHMWQFCFSVYHFPLGCVRCEVQPPKHPELVPFGVAPMGAWIDFTCEVGSSHRVCSISGVVFGRWTVAKPWLSYLHKDLLQHLQWLLKKKRTHQNIFLLGFADI